MGVEFNKPLDATTIVPANFTVSQGTVKSVNYMGSSGTLYALSAGVIVTVSGLTEGNTYTLGIKGVADTLGNVATTNVSFTVSQMGWGECGVDVMASDAATYPGPTPWVGGFPDGYAVGRGQWRV